MANGSIRTRACIADHIKEAWGTAELVSHRLLDSDGMIQEFEYPEGKISIDLNELRYRIQGGSVETDDWVQVDV